MVDSSRRALRRHCAYAPARILSAPILGWAPPHQDRVHDHCHGTDLILIKPLRRDPLRGRSVTATNVMHVSVDLSPGHLSNAAPGEHRRT